MRQRPTPIFRPMAVCLGALCVILAPETGRADGDGLVAGPPAFHCGAPPHAYALVERAPRRAERLPDGRLARRISTFPRYLCADAPGAPRTGIDGIGVYVDVEPPAPRPRPRWRGDGWPR